MKARIAIAEDDVDILFTLKFILESAGYETELSASGKYILEGAYDPPDLFILDKRMPDMDGLEICRQLRSRPQFASIPIIIISASPKFGSHALLAGANDFMEKPFQRAELLAMVGKYIKADSDYL